MSRPIPIPPNNARAGHLAMAKRLGLDPGTINANGFTVTTDSSSEGMALVTWTGVVQMPADEAFRIIMGDDTQPPS